MTEQVDANTDRTPEMRQLLGSIVITVISVGMLLGTFLLSRLDTSSARPSPTQPGVVVLPSSTPFLPEVTSVPLPTMSPAPSPTVADTAVPPASTASPSPTSPVPLIPSCPKPPGWFVYTVRQGDTLAGLAWRAGITLLALREANCLGTSAIYPGQQIYLPPAFYASPTPWACGPPLGWVVYIVQPGDTLYSLSVRFGVGIEAIRRANCLQGYTIRAGQALYLPPLLPVPTQTPVATDTPAPTETGVPTVTPTPVPTQSPTVTSSPIPTGSPTSTAIPTSTGTATHTPTHTPTPIETVGPTATSTFTPTPTSTEPATSTYTPTPTPTDLPTSTHTPTPTSTPSE